MNTFFRIIVAAVTLTTVALGTQSAEPPKAIGALSRQGEVLLVSPMGLIVSPEKYDGKRILTDAYLQLAENGFDRAMLLYCFREDMNEGRRAHAFAILLSPDLAKQSSELAEFDKKRVKLVGIFRRNTEKIMYAAPGGAVTSVEWIAVAR